VNLLGLILLLKQFSVYLNQLRCDIT